VDVGLLYPIDSAKGKNTDLN